MRKLLKKSTKLEYQMRKQLKKQIKKTDRDIIRYNPNILMMKQDSKN